MQQLPYPSQIRLLQLTALSGLLHILLLLGLNHLPKAEAPVQRAKVAVRVVQTPKPTPKPETPTEPKPKKAPKAPPPPRSLSEKTPKPEASPAKPVQGLSPESFSNTGTASMAAPAGNTTLAPDEGKRLSPEEIMKLGKNLAEDAQLIAGTFERPAYTPEAEDAGLEGRFVVDVYVDEGGQVTSAELRKPIGFGMDLRVIESAKKSRFKPRKDAKGQAIAGWTEIKVRLTLDQ